MLIRPEIEQDWPSIAAVVGTAFRQAEHSDGNEAAVVAALRGDGALALSLVAIAERALAGHVAFSKVTVPGAQGQWFGLGPLSVLPRLQSRGIGAALVHEGLEHLRRNSAAGCTVLGEPDYYRRFGFSSDPALTFGGQADRHFQRLVFQGPAPCGDAVYHRAFMET